jgi:hypothetical protein
MSIRLMSMVWELDLPPSEKIVLLALADQASDEGTQCWPSVGRIARRCGLGDRTVRQALGALEAKQHLTRDHREGSSTQYRVHPGGSLGLAVAAGAASIAPETHPPPRRASRVPEDFAPAMSGKTGAAVAQWPRRRLAAELEKFADYHRAKGTLSFDWQASWRSWVRKAQIWEPVSGVQRPTRSVRAREAEPDPILAALRRAVAEERAERGEADHPRTRPALSPGRG